VPADSASEIVKFTISIPRESCTNAKAKYSRSVVPPDPSVHFYHCAPHLKYVAALPCNLSLMACFAGINVSRGSVATYAKRGGIFNMRLTANLLRNLSVEKFYQLAKI